ncbi:MAG: hypothetical protein LBG43_09910 [Treponema sp.]|nr:hypothetical protein [Treponema sp.]
MFLRVETWVIIHYFLDYGNRKRREARHTHVAKSFHIVYNVLKKKTVRLDVRDAAVMI